MTLLRLLEEPCVGRLEQPSGVHAPARVGEGRLDLGVPGPRQLAAAQEEQARVRRAPTAASMARW